MQPPTPPVINNFAVSFSKFYYQDRGTKAILFNRMKERWDLVTSTDRPLTDSKETSLTE